MLLRKYDKKNRFVSVFNPDTGFYMRTGVFDDDGKSMAGTLAFGGTSTAPTITFTPADTELGTITSVSVTSGLKDNNGVGVTPYINASLS